MANCLACGEPLEEDLAFDPRYHSSCLGDPGTVGAYIKLLTWVKHNLETNPEYAWNAEVGLKVRHEIWRLEGDFKKILKIVGCPEFI